VGGESLEVAIGRERERWTLAELRDAHGALARLFP
jgi:hypothetical protein